MKLKNFVVFANFARSVEVTWLNLDCNKSFIRSGKCLCQDAKNMEDKGIFEHWHGIMYVFRTFRSYFGLLIKDEPWLIARAGMLIMQSLVGKIQKCKADCCWNLGVFPVKRFFITYRRHDHSSVWPHIFHRILIC